MYLTIAEKFDKVNKAPTTEEKVNLLRKYAREYPLQFTDYLRMSFDPTFEFDLPEGLPSYRRNPNPIEHAGSNLIREHRKLHHVMKGSDIDPLKKEILFIQILESVSGEESDILAGIHLGGLQDKYPSITFDLIEQAFPNLIVVNGESKDSTKSVTKKAVAPKPIAILPEDRDTTTIVLEKPIQMVTEVKEEAPYGYKADGTPRKKPAPTWLDGKRGRKRIGEADDRIQDTFNGIDID